MMYVTEYRATAANAPLLFWEVTAYPPLSVDGEQVSLGSLGNANGYERRVIGKAHSFDGLVGMLANQDVGEIRVSEAEHAWLAAAEGQDPARCRVRPRGNFASEPARSSGVSYGATSASYARGSTAAATSNSFSLTMLFIIVMAAVILWLALI